MANIIDGIQEQANRVRKLIKIYETIPTGFIAVALMEQAIKESETAISSGDVVKMIAIYKKLSEFQE